MGKLNYHKQLLLACFLFTLHNTEEAVAFTLFAYPTELRFPFQFPTPACMITSIVTLTIIAWLVIALVIWRGNEIFKRNVLTTLATVFAVNIIFPHIAGTIFLQRYFPAVMTAIVLYLPYVIWLLPKLHRIYPTRKEFYTVSINRLFITAIVTAGLQLVAYFLS